MTKTEPGSSPVLLPSQVVKSLATLASNGQYVVDPQGARNMNTLFVEVARVINILEAVEAANAKLMGVEETEDDS